MVWRLNFFSKLKEAEKPLQHSLSLRIFWFFMSLEQTMSYPTLAQFWKGPTRDSRLVVRRSLLSLLPKMLLFLVLVLFIFAANLYVTFADQPPFIFSVISPRWFAVIPLFVLLQIMRIYYDDLYIFSDNELTRQQGRLSYNYRVPSLKYADIKGINVRQTFWGRVFGYGAIEVGTAAQHDSELVLDGVSAPHELATLIEQLRDFNRSRGSKETE